MSALLVLDAVYLLGIRFFMLGKMWDVHDMIHEWRFTRWTCDNVWDDTSTEG